MLPPGFETHLADMLAQADHLSPPRRRRMAPADSGTTSTPQSQSPTHAPSKLASLKSVKALQELVKVGSLCQSHRASCNSVYLRFREEDQKTVA